MRFGRHRRTERLAHRRRTRPPALGAVEPESFPGVPVVHQGVVEVSVSASSWAVSSRGDQPMVASMSCSSSSGASPPSPQLGHAAPRSQHAAPRSQHAAPRSQHAASHFQHAASHFQHAASHFQPEGRQPLPAASRRCARALSFGERSPHYDPLVSDVKKSVPRRELRCCHAETLALPMEDAVGGPLPP